jgi:hypothetical protein
MQRMGKQAGLGNNCKITPAASGSRIVTHHQSHL